MNLPEKEDIFGHKVFYIKRDRLICDASAIMIQDHEGFKIFYTDNAKNVDIIKEKIHIVNKIKAVTPWDDEIQIANFLYEEL